jgi:hypothetical protein
VFGGLPVVLGAGGALYARWEGVVWLTDAGAFWPIVLSGVSMAVLIKLVFSPFEEMTGSVAAWLTLLITWFYVPMWATAAEIPYSAAVVDRAGQVHRASGATRFQQHKVWLLTPQSGNRIVPNVAGKMTLSQLDLEYHFRDSYVASRQDGEDGSKTLARVAETKLHEVARGTRRSRIAFINDRATQERALAEICRAVTGEARACPIHMTLAPVKEATSPGELWSTQYTEDEAIEELHLPTLLHLLTQSDSAPARRSTIFKLVLDNAESVAPLAELAQKSHLLDDGQFDEVVRRILLTPGCDDGVIPIVARVNRLSERQGAALRAKVLAEADLAAVIANATRLRISDAELAALDARLRTAVVGDPSVAVSALLVFGARLSPETQRASVEGIVRASAGHALTALERLNFSAELRQRLMAKVLDDAVLDDFSRWSKEALQGVLTPVEMRGLVAMAVKRSEMDEKWIDFVLAALPMRDMLPAERRSLLSGLLFKSPKAALEFVSQNREYLDPNEVGEITRDYTRTITRDFCLHLSHRNKNWRTKYFSEAQLQIFRECAAGK